MPKTLSLLSLLCIGCGASQASPAPAPNTRVAPATVVPVARAASDVLRKDALFADLVRSGSELASTARPTSSCLLQQTADAFVLRAELASAIRPLPAAPDDLGEALKSAAHVELLSTWGRYGDGNGKLALAAFSASAPSHDALALLLTSRGIALRSPSGSPVAPLDGLDLAQAEATLAAIDPEQRATLFVAAEARVHVSELFQVLEQLGHARRQVVLAVSLAPNTALPLPVSASAKAERCPDGLSNTDAPEGSLPIEEIRRGVKVLQEQAVDCLNRGDARAAAGGRLQLAFRIAESGRVQEACITRDEIDDPGLASCVIRYARQLMFAAPSPTGVIDLQLPIALQPGPFATASPVCGPS